MGLYNFTRSLLDDAPAICTAAIRTWLDVDATEVVACALLLKLVLLSISLLAPLLLLSLFVEIAVVVAAVVDATCVVEVTSLVDVAILESDGEEVPSKIEVCSGAVSIRAMFCDDNNETDCDFDVDVDFNVGTGANVDTIDDVVVVAIDFADIDDAAESDDDEFCAIATLPKLPLDAGARAVADFSFAALFFAGADICGTVVETSAAMSASGSIAAGDEDAPPSKMVSTPALFIPNALLIAAGQQ